MLRAYRKIIEKGGKPPMYTSNGEPIPVDVEFSERSLSEIYEKSEDLAKAWYFKSKVDACWWTSI